jgi:radical SAM superfamily enzyme YgiQ (UPF0313 family)
MMRVLLVQPRVNAEPAYPLALASLVPLLREAGHEVSGVDLVFENERTILQAAQNGSIDWVGATVLHHNTDNVMPWMRQLQSIRTVRTFVAGALPTLDPMGAIARTGADFAVIGPPELSVPALLTARNPGTLSGVVDTRHPEISWPAHRPLASLPLPDRTVFPVEQYSYAMRSTSLPYAQVYTSRGCWRSCPYCPVPALRPARFDPRPAEQIVDEWVELIAVHGVTSIHVEDDNFLADKERIHALCSELIERGVRVNWELVNGIRVDQVDRVLINRMAEAGCVRIVFSMEHLELNTSPAIGHTLAEARQAVEWARAARMRIGGYFMVGLPGISLQQTLTSIRLSLSLNLDDANWVPFYETPGSGYSGAGTTIDTVTVSRHTSRRIAKAAHIAFFSQPRSFGRLASEMAATPATLPSMVGKAVELIRAGGPIPMRDTP